MNWRNKKYVIGSWVDNGHDVTKSALTLNKTILVFLICPEP